MKRGMAYLKKLEATNRMIMERGNALRAERAAKKRALSEAARVETEDGDKPARRKFKVKTKPKLLDEATLAKRWKVPESLVRKMRKSGNGPPATEGDAGICYRLRDVRLYERTRSFAAQIASRILM